jgi:hypothetical protein
MFCTAQRAQRIIRKALEHQQETKERQQWTIIAVVLCFNIYASAHVTLTAAEQKLQHHGLYKLCTYIVQSDAAHWYMTCFFQISYKSHLGKRLWGQGVEFFVIYYYNTQWTAYITSIMKKNGLVLPMQVQGLPFSLTIYVMIKHIPIKSKALFSKFIVPLFRKSKRRG